MPITVKYDWDDGPTQFGTGGGSDALRCNVHGASTNVAAWEAVAAFTPPVYNGFIRDDIAVTRVGPLFHKAVVSYSTSGAAGTDTAVGETPPVEHPAPATPTEALGAGYDFSFSAEMQKRTQSIRTKFGRAAGDGSFQGGAYGPSEFGSAINYGGAVGISRSGGNVRVEGYDAPVVASTWTRTVMFESMTFAFQDTLAGLVGKKNSATFYNSQPGECLLWSVSGRHHEGTKYSLAFTFHKKKNKTNFVVSPDPTDTGFPFDHTKADALVIPAAAGWDIIWVLYGEEVEGDELVKRPIFAYVEEVIEDGDFSLLRIGV